MTQCWNCHREQVPDGECWVCSQGGQSNRASFSDFAMVQPKNFFEEDNFPGVQPEPPQPVHEKATPSYLTPYTGRSARHSIDTLEYQKSIHPKSFIETGSTTGRRYVSRNHEFDFRNDGGPVVSFISTTGTSRFGSSESLDSDQPFGAIEIVRAEKLPRSKDQTLEEAPMIKKPPNPAAIDVRGWRRGLLVASVLFGLFLGFLDTTIVAVALPSIADDFDDYGLSTWVVTAYLLTYMGSS
jgi:hypothetical protein